MTGVQTCALPILAYSYLSGEELRPSRLFNSMLGYVKKSMVTIFRAFMMYKPMKFFAIIGSIIFLLGAALGVRFLVYFFMGTGGGHVQSLILCSTLLLLGFQTIVIGFLADVIAANRKLLEDVQYHVRKMEYDGVKNRVEYGKTENGRGAAGENSLGKEEK